MTDKKLLTKVKEHDKRINKIRFNTSNIPKDIKCPVCNKTLNDHGTEFDPMDIKGMAMKIFVCKCGCEIHVPVPFDVSYK